MDSLQCKDNSKLNKSYTRKNDCITKETREARIIIPLPKKARKALQLFKDFQIHSLQTLYHKAAKFLNTSNNCLKCSNTLLFNFFFPRWGWGGWGKGGWRGRGSTFTANIAFNPGELFPGGFRSSHLTSQNSTSGSIFFHGVQTSRTVCSMRQDFWIIMACGA